MSYSIDNQISSPEVPIIESRTKEVTPNLVSMDKIASAIDNPTFKQIKLRQLPVPPQIPPQIPAQIPPQIPPQSPDNNECNCSEPLSIINNSSTPIPAPNYCKVNIPTLNNGLDTYLGISSNKYLDGSPIKFDNTGVNNILRIYTEKDCELMNGIKDMNKDTGTYIGECIIKGPDTKPNGSYTLDCANAPPNNGLTVSPTCPIEYNYDYTQKSPYTLAQDININNLNTIGNYMCASVPIISSNQTIYNSTSQKGVINFDDKTNENKFNLETNSQNKNNIFTQFSCPPVSGDWTPGQLSDYNGNLLCITTQNQKNQQNNSKCIVNKN